MLSFRLGPAEVRFTGRADGDFAAHLEPSCRAVVDLAVRTVRQVHGGDVVMADAHGPDARAEADGLVTQRRDVALAVRVADCAPVVLAGDGAVAVVHAGWRSLEAGVVQEAVRLLRSLGAVTLEAALGPCVHPECYEFGSDDLDRLADRFGTAIRSTTARGTPGLDLPRTVRAALEQAGVPLVHDADRCTSCSPGEFWSHRARGDLERQAAVAWLA
ncbi:MAG TPA: polyphenol oxidase family protein [Acidimicrobiales bacterium]|nr:polyphenol oxidase family protein [Acidimicrobiales bacterium]